MMRIKKLITSITLSIFSISMLASCATNTDNNKKSDILPEDEAGGIVEFRPVDCGIQALDEYVYPFLGLNFKLSEDILDKIDSRELFVYTEEDYTESFDIAYALLRFSSTTPEQRDEKTMSVDIISWEEALEKTAAIGAYTTDKLSELDTLTGCDTHEKIGESSDGKFVYYISTNSNSDSALLDEFKQTQINLSEVHEFDINDGYNAFSTDKIDGISDMGTFTTTDIFDETYTQDIFKDYDITLVNAFATWCSPCVNEIPDLEKLRQEYEKKGIKLGIIAVVLDAKTQIGIDEGAIENAQTLYKKSKAQFPFLIPDDGNMNGRLTGIENVPESFFVDSNGNIVSEAYVGARSQDEWSEIVKEELNKLEGNN